MSNGSLPFATTGEPRRPARRRRSSLRFLNRLLLGLKPNQRLLPTREGRVYVLVWLALLAIGLYQQSNLVLLTAGLAAGPMVASILASATMLRRQTLARRAPAYVFSGEPLTIDYTLENGRPWNAALALIANDELTPAEGALPDARRLLPRVVFRRVPAHGMLRLRWHGTGPRRGRYRFTQLELTTRSPFGLLERTLSVPAPGELVVYPRVGTLARRWLQAYRESTETKRGRRHDRSANQLDYHGLRDYRPGDSPRWLHWRTTARLGQPMVKEFEQQHDQDIAVLVDPWLPRSRVSPAQREALEAAVSFAATFCVEVCRRQGRRLFLGWTGPTPGLIQGTASIRLLHEVLAQLAVLRGSHEGQLSALFDALPAHAIREAMLIVVSTRPLSLPEELERSRRLSGSAGRGITSRVTLLDASSGDFEKLISYDERASTQSIRRDWDLDEDDLARADVAAADHDAGVQGTSELGS